MPVLESTRTAMGLLKLTGHDPRLYVPGSLYLVGGFMDWTEKCSPRCKHEHSECHSSRTSTAPTGWIDGDA